MSQQNLMLEEIIKALRAKLNSYIQCDPKGNLLVTDPHDKKVISAHYAMSHTAAGILLENHDDNIGHGLLKSLLRTWEDDCQEPAFHFDFNNFALCIILKQLKNIDAYQEKCDQIVQTLIKTQDSEHSTVNWLPMRYFVNYVREKETGLPQYQERMAQIKKQMRQAIWADGYVEDRLPKGLSMNLQYDLSTVAVMAFINEETGEKRFDISELGNALIQAMLPDGDINYLGRGCNQIFAWGPWLYLLCSLGQKVYYEQSLSFLYEHVFSAIANDNLMLNSYAGEEKYLWWDYHYASVYLAHLYMWLVLAQKLGDKQEAVVPQLSTFGGESGIKVYRQEKSFVCIFGGRKEYLAEYGPVVAALWTQKYGMLHKGAFGPWQGAFGNQYSVSIAVMLNFLGLLKIRENSRINENRLLKKAGVQFPVAAGVELTPLLVPVSISKKNGQLSLVFSPKIKGRLVFNLPLGTKTIQPNTDVQLFIDGHSERLYAIGTIRNQYGVCDIMQTLPREGTVWELKIDL